MSDKIKASEIYLKDLLGNKFLFEIPNFQRPFSWESEHFSRLVNDICDALNFNRIKYQNDFEKYDPFFLGTIILWTQDLKEDGSGVFAVIDGQQRLTSIAVLIASLRDMTATEEFRDTLQRKIFQKADKAEGTPERVRLRVREKEKDFFHKYILNPGGTLKVNEIEQKDLTEPKQHFLQAIETFHNAFSNDIQINHGLTPDDFIPYFLQKVALVYVRTDTLASGFRLFNIINTRGLSLNNADLLKSDNLMGIEGESERKKYTEVWENIEEEIGSEDLEMLIGFIRSIKLKERARQNIYEEFEKIIFLKDPHFKGRNFINYLNEIKDIYVARIKGARLHTNDPSMDTYFHNLISVMRDFLPFNEWMSALIKFKEKFDNNEHLYQFLRNLEKKIVVEWVAGYSFTERLTRIYKIVKLIEENSDPDSVNNDQIFAEGIQDLKNYFLRSLNDNFLYNKANTRMAKYILLRLCMEKQDQQNLRFSYSGYITVEHILPRNPHDDYWLSNFNDAQRLELTNRLGNLTLLNNRKNPQAGNKPFHDKVKYYFEKKSDFAITEELKDYADWNPGTLQERHDRLIKQAENTWLS